MSNGLQSSATGELSPAERFERLEGDRDDHWGSPRRRRPSAQGEFLHLYAAVEAEDDRDGECDPCDDQDLVREDFQLLRQRGLLDRRGLKHPAVDD